jgi:hypothetical protein
MAVNNFIPTIWSARILSNLMKALVYGNLVSRDYEGDIRQFGDSVKIGGIGAITVGAYTKNSTTISWQTLADATQTLTIDQSKYFAFKVDDVDQVQTKPKLMDEAMKEAAYAIADTIDQFIAAKYANAATANKVGSDGASAVTVGYGSGETDPYKQLVDMGVLLTQASVPTEGRWGVVSPWYTGMLRKSATFVANPASPSGEAAMINGYVGRVAGFDLYESNNVTNDAQATPTYRAMFGVRSAISLAIQKELAPEAVRLETQFADGIRGLVLYGGQVVRPDALTVLFCKKGANA